MGTDTEHKERVNHNREFYEQIIQPVIDEFRDWTIAVLFYIGVHCIECYRWDKHNTDSYDHGDRKRFLGGERPYNNQELRPLYGWLLKKSKIARYNPQSHINNHPNYINDYELLKFKDNVNYVLDLINEPPIP